VFQHLYVSMEAGTLAKTIIERERGATRDDDLVQRVADGDERALGELYDRHGRTAYGLALRILRDPGLAEDAVQEAFVGVWRSAARFQAERGSARSWILTLVHHRAVDAVRREERSRSAHDLVEPDASWSESAEDAASLRAEQQTIQRALELLPSSQRLLLELAYYGGLTQRELAGRLELPLGTVKSRTHAALARLHALLHEEPLPANTRVLTARLG
jgi:RNA polymerase sigma-70 factor (ECF subfamily)